MDADEAAGLVERFVARPGGAIGEWSTDERGWPTFVVDPPAGCGPGGRPEAMWHELGNPRITATAHAGGWLEVWATARGMARLTGPGSGWGPVGAGRRDLRATWGMGYAEWHARFTLPGSAGGCQARRRITVDAHEPLLRVEVELTGPVLPEAWEERWIPEVQHLLVGALMSPAIAPPPGYGIADRVAWRVLYGTSGVSRGATLTARRLVGRWLRREVRFDPDVRGILVPPRREAPAGPVAEPAFVDLALPWFAVASADRERRCSTADGALRVEVSDAERADGRATLQFAVVLERTETDVASTMHRVREVEGTVPGGPPAAALSLPSAPWLERETAWHGHLLLAERQHDDYFGRTFVSQGSAYGYIHGLHGAPRDYAIFSVPLAVLDPAAAKDLVRVMLMLTKPSGGMHYAHLGRGQASSGGVHAAPTDLPIFLLWAVTELVWSTGDDAFLDEVVPFYPKASGAASTVADRVRLAWCYLRDRVGVGPHGLLRVGSGDWNDPISAMVADRKAFHDHGESMFNTGFACHVLPRAADLIEQRSPSDASEMRAYAHALRRAVDAHAWTGRWFVRGFDGRGAPVGADHLFVDGNVWGLIAQLGSSDDRHRLVEEIGARCDDPSPIGATILDRPHPVRFGMLAPGWDCNGGVWAAVNAFLTWGYALHDPARAWRLLAKQSFAAHASAYPEHWLGVWSGPDAYNAHFGTKAGDTFIQPATPMAQWPVMNANAHAGPLLALLKVLGVEATPAGLTVFDRGAAPTPWSLTTPSVTLTSGAAQDLSP